MNLCFKSIFDERSHLIYSKSSHEIQFHWEPIRISLFDGFDWSIMLKLEI